MIKVRYGCAVSSSACCRLLRVSGHTCAAFAPAQPVAAARGAPSPFLCYRKSKSVSLITIASLLRYPPYPRRLLWLILPSSLLVFQPASNPHILLVEPHYLIAHLCHILSSSFHVSFQLMTSLPLQQATQLPLSLPLLATKPYRTRSSATLYSRKRLLREITQRLHLPHFTIVKRLVADTVRVTARVLKLWVKKGVGTMRRCNRFIICSH